MADKCKGGVIWPGFESPQWRAISDGLSAPQWIADAYDEMSANVDVMCESVALDTRAIRASFDQLKTWRALRDAAGEVQRLHDILQSQILAATSRPGGASKSSNADLDGAHVRARRALVTFFEAVLFDFDATRFPLALLAKAAKAVESGHAVPGELGAVVRPSSPASV